MSTDIKQLLENVASGSVSVDNALLTLKEKPFEDIGYAKVDMHRKLRQGVAEVIYGAGKTPEQIAGIAETMLSHGEETILITRISADAARSVRHHFPMAYYADARAASSVRCQKPTASAPSSLPPAAPAIFPSPKKRRSPPPCSVTTSSGSTTSASPGYTAPSLILTRS